MMPDKCQGRVMKNKNEIMLDSGCPDPILSCHFRSIYHTVTDAALGTCNRHIKCSH